MSSPSIHHSSPVPNLPDPPHSRPHSGRRATSPEVWPLKDDKFIVTNASNSTKQHPSDAILEEKRYFPTKSPYYKGLTDFSLVINRERLLLETSPERDSDPPIPHSLFEPDIAKTLQSHGPIDDSSQATSPRISWHKKVGNVIRRRASLDLTHENLEEINKKSPINLIADDKTHFTSSPYYKGLTDFTLVINKERLQVESSPGGAQSPPIRRSISDPDISETHHSDLPSQLATSPETLWLKKASTNSTKKNSELLTQERLEELDMKNEIREDKRYSTSSPYYKGLTDFSLAINRDKIPPLPLSPERESQVASSTSSSSRSSFVVKMQEWSAACFINRRSHLEHSVPTSSSAAKTRARTTEITKESTHLGKEDVNWAVMEDDGTEISNKGKPLRERVSDSSARPPLSPPKTLPAKKVVLNAKEISETENERKNFWADKYRPDALKDFICNRNKAIELQNLVQ